MISTIIIVIFAGFTIIFATLKRFQVPTEKSRHLLHFSGKNNLSEKEYLNNMAYLEDSLHDLALEVSPDPYHLSNGFLVPKFG